MHKGPAVMVSTPRSSGSVVLVVGTGSAGMRHLQVLAQQGVSVVAVPARPERALEIRRQGIPAANSLAEGLALLPRAAVIATDTGRHRDDALTCLRAGCDVLVEKPLAPNGDDARVIEAAAHKLGRRAHVACCLRFDPGLVWVRENLRELGRIVGADSECLSWLPSWRPERDHRATYAARAGEGGVLLDLVHEIDACLWMFGPVESVAAHLDHSGLVGLDAVEDSASLLLRHRTGVSVTMRLSYAVRPSTRRLRIWGEHGTIEWDGIARRATLVSARGTLVGGLTWPTSATMYEEQAAAWAATLFPERATAANPRSRSQLCELGAAVEAVDVCDLAKRSSATGRRLEAA